MRVLCSFVACAALTSRPQIKRRPTITEALQRLVGGGKKSEPAPAEKAEDGRGRRFTDALGAMLPGAKVNRKGGSFNLDTGKEKVRCSRSAPQCVAVCAADVVRLCVQVVVQMTTDKSERTTHVVWEFDLNKKHFS